MTDELLPASPHGVVPVEKKSWRPRASKLGAYVACDMRAALDTAVELGEFVAADPEIAKALNPGNSPVADFGTWAHYILQAGIGCQFPAAAKEYEPTQEQLANAAKLFGGDIDVTKQKILDCATLAAKSLPELPANVTWLAESEWFMPYLRGHIDFLSSDGLVIVDLKTTGKPPGVAGAKVEHLIQLLAYRALTGSRATRGVILYVDRNAEWCVPVEVDFTSERLQLYQASLERYATRLSTRNYEGLPRIGAHCTESWCPYVAGCKSTIVPPTKVGRAFAHKTPSPKVKDIL